MNLTEKDRNSLSVSSFLFRKKEKIERSDKNE